MEYRRDQGIQEEFFGIGLTSRKNLCLNPDVSKERKGRSVDSKCRNLTASWVRAKAVRRRPEQEQDGDAMDVDQSPVPLCDFYEVFYHNTISKIYLLNKIYYSNWKLLIPPIPYPMAFIH